MISMGYDGFVVEGCVQKVTAGKTFHSLPSDFNLI